MEQRVSLENRLPRSANRVSNRWIGWLWAVVGTALLLFVWAMTGPILQFSDEGQLFINTSSTVLTLGTVYAVQQKRRPATDTIVAPSTMDPPDRRLDEAHGDQPTGAASA
jgi:low affinity Fe/Cu permease